MEQADVEALATNRPQFYGIPVFHQRHAPRLSCCRQLAALVRPARVVGDVGALSGRQLGTLCSGRPPNE
jgi:hypothetical protein